MDKLRHYDYLALQKAGGVMDYGTVVLRTSLIAGAPRQIVEADEFKESQ